MEEKAKAAYRKTWFLRNPAQSTSTSSTSSGANTPTSKESDYDDELDVVNEQDHDDLGEDPMEGVEHGISEMHIAADPPVVEDVEHGISEMHIVADPPVVDGAGNPPTAPPAPATRPLAEILKEGEAALARAKKVAQDWGVADRMG